MFDNLEKFIKAGNPIKIFLSGAHLRVVRSCEGLNDPIKVYGESAYLSEALIRADRSIVDGIQEKSGYYYGSDMSEGTVDTLLCYGTVYIEFKNDKFIMVSDHLTSLDVTISGSTLENLLIEAQNIVNKTLGKFKL